MTEILIHLQCPICKAEESGAHFLRQIEGLTTELDEIYRTKRREARSFAADHWRCFSVDHEIKGEPNEVSNTQVQMEGRAEPAADNPGSAQPPDLRPMQNARSKKRTKA